MKAERINIILSIMLSAAIVAACVFNAVRFDADAALAAAGIHSRRYVIIDAGHGGFDGGASGADGTVEKDINLQISQKLEEMLSALGFCTVMVRDSDTSVGSGGSTIREKKRNDIKYRLSLMKEYDNAIFLCIHQNYFGGSSSHGAQIFYAPSADGSKELAQSIQSSFVAMVQPDNHREIKKCTDDVYLIYNATTTAVLVECGFLSNAAELKNLKDDEYQRKVAFAIACGTLGYVYGS